MRHLDNILQRTQRIMGNYIVPMSRRYLTQERHRLLQPSRSDTITLRSNTEYWKQLQDEGYFENHPCYLGLRDLGGDTCAGIEAFLKLNQDMKVVVIGCGYGRETLHIAPRVGHVYGIDVNETILTKADTFLSTRGIANFTGVLVDQYKTEIPMGIDLVYSVIVMQHLTRDLVRDYFRTLGRKLSSKGNVLVQFLEELYDGVDKSDAELRAYEPSVSWTIPQLVELSRDAELPLIEVRSQLVTPTAIWHWAYFGGDT
jgi:SAM-dependent methyltransferase